MKKGIFCISLDLEMLWAWKELEWQERVSRSQKTRDVVKEILKLFDKYRIPVTWAVVGALVDPRNKSKGELWYAPDLIRLIKSHKIHEIGLHSYSHIDFGHASGKEAFDDLKNGIRSLKKYGVTPTSFVFPGNIVNHLSILKKLGFKTYREPHPWWKNRFGSLMRGFIFVDSLLPLGRAYRPLKRQGLVAIYGSIVYLSSYGFRKYIPICVRTRKVIRSIDKAVRDKSVCHLWFHPMDIADGSERMLDGIEEILVYANEKRKEGELNIFRMKDL